MTAAEFFWERVNTLGDPTLKGNRGIFAKYGDICAYCGIFLRAKASRVPKRYWRTKEHVIPRCHGGGGILNDNLVPACYSCNNRKKNMTPLGWLMVVKSDPSCKAAKTIGIDHRWVRERVLRVSFVDKNGIEHRKVVRKHSRRSQGA